MTIFNFLGFKGHTLLRMIIASRSQHFLFFFFLKNGLFKTFFIHILKNHWIKKKIEMEKKSTEKKIIVHEGKKKYGYHHMSKMSKNITFEKIEK